MIILDFDERIAAFMSAMDVDCTTLYTTRKLLNTPTPPRPTQSQINLVNSGGEEKMFLDSISVPVLIAVLRRYFMELPVPLLFFDELESFKSIYLSC